MLTTISSLAYRIDLQLDEELTHATRIRFGRVSALSSVDVDELRDSLPEMGGGEVLRDGLHEETLLIAVRLLLGVELDLPLVVEVGYLSGGGCSCFLLFLEFHESLLFQLDLPSS